MALGIEVYEIFVPQEIWDNILELLSPEPRGLANSEVRSRLSVETFAPGLQLDEGSPGLSDLLSFVSTFGISYERFADNRYRDNAPDGLMMSHGSTSSIGLRFDSLLPGQFRD